MEEKWIKEIRVKFDGYMPDTPIPPYCIRLKRHYEIWYILTAIAAAAAIMLILFLPGILTNNRATEPLHRAIAEASPVLNVPAAFAGSAKVPSLSFDNQKHPQSTVTPQDNPAILPADHSTDCPIIPESPGNPSADVTGPVSEANQDERIADILSESNEKRKSKRFSARIMLAPQVKGTSNVLYQYPGGIGLPDEIPGIVKDVSVKRSFKAGLAIGYSIHPRLTLESGLIYSNHTINQQLMDADERVHEIWITKLHYLGLPLKLNVSALRTKRMEIYGTAGGDASLLVSGFSQEISGFTAGSSPITGHPVLFTFTGGAGLAYAIVPALSIYVEPLATYGYMSSGQIDYYANQPWSFDIAFGLSLKLQ